MAVVSGNDAAVALAEHLAGSEEGFVEQMNQRAAELGMADTCFVNCTGLPAAGHLTSAHDIAVMSRALIQHPKIRDYTTIWMDSIRGGQFQLANTNKLVRFYEGATGLKTGSTDAAGYCLSATAERDGMEPVSYTHLDVYKRQDHGPALDYIFPPPKPVPDWVKEIEDEETPPEQFGLPF